MHKADANGVATNLLEIDHKRDPSKVVFMVNSEPVYTLDAKATEVRAPGATMADRMSRPRSVWVSASLAGPPGSREAAMMSFSIATQDRS